MDFSRRLYRWASEGVDMYAYTRGIRHNMVPTAAKDVMAALSYNIFFFLGGGATRLGRRPNGCTSIHY